MKANGNKGDFLDNKWVKRISYSFAIFLMFMMIYNVIKSKNIPGEGELIIVGDNVSIGYSNRADLNSEKYFIHNGKR